MTLENDVRIERWDSNPWKEIIMWLNANYFRLKSLKDAKTNWLRFVKMLLNSCSNNSAEIDIVKSYDIGTRRWSMKKNQ